MKKPRKQNEQLWKQPGSGLMKYAMKPNAFWQEGNYREAIPRYHRVIAEGERVNYHEAVIAAQKQIARCYYHLGYFEVALGYMEKAASLSVLDRAEENFFDNIKRKLWDREGRRRRAEGF